MIRQSWSAAVVVVAALCFGELVQAAPITVINPGGEVYPTGPNTAINPGGVSPIATTGWNSTLAATPGEEGVEGINNQTAAVIGGAMRLAFGAVNAAVDDDDTNLAEDFVLFQETGAVVQALDTITMNWIGRSFFQFDVGTDFQTSLFGYVDGGGNLVMVDTLQHPSTIGGVWTPTLHGFQVPNGSPLIGENLVIGFFTDTPSQALGGFTSVDNVTLDVTAIPEPATSALCLVAGLAGIGCGLRRRANRG